MRLDSDILYTFSFRRFLRERHFDYFPDALLHIFADLERQRQRQGFIRAFILDPHYLFTAFLAAYLNYLDTLTCWTLTERPKSFVNLDPSLAHTLVADRNRLEAQRFARLLDNPKSRVYLTSSRRPDHARGKTFARAILLNSHCYCHPSFCRLLTTAIGPIDPVPGSILIIHANTTNRRAWLRSYATSRPRWWLTYTPGAQQSLLSQSPPDPQEEHHRCIPPPSPPPESPPESPPGHLPRLTPSRRITLRPSAHLRLIPKTPLSAVAATALHHLAA